MPWRVKRGRILMGLSGALPPYHLTASSHCFLQQLRSHPGRSWSPTLHSEGLSLLPGAWKWSGGLQGCKTLASLAAHREGPGPAGLRFWGAAGLPNLDTDIKRAQQRRAQVLLWKWGWLPWEGGNKGNLTLLLPVGPPVCLPWARLGRGRALDQSLLLPTSPAASLQYRGGGISYHHLGSALM